MEKVIKLLTKYYPVYLSGLWGTLWISAATVLFGCLLGLLVALMRMSRNKVLGAVSHAYIEVLRGTPVLLQLGKISDLQHSGTSMHFLSSYSEYTLTQWQSQPLKYEFLNKYPPCKPGGYGTVKSYAQI